MLPMSVGQLAGALSVGLEKIGVNPDTLKKIAAEAGYNDSPWFGATSKRLSLAVEAAIAHTALTIVAVNHVFTNDYAKPIIDAFLTASRGSVFRVLESKCPDFKHRYEHTIATYFRAFNDRQPGLAASFVFMQNLRLDPLKNMTGQLALAERFGGNLQATVAMLKTVRIVASDEAAIAEIRATVARPQ